MNTFSKITLYKLYSVKFNTVRIHNNTGAKKVVSILLSSDAIHKIDCKYKIYTIHNLTVNLSDEIALLCITKHKTKLKNDSNKSILYTIRQVTSN